MKVFKNFDLTHLNTFGIPCKTAFFTTVSDCRKLKELQHLCAGESRMILGGGSNILFTKDYRGLIIQNLLKGVRVIEESETEVQIEAMGGERWHDLVMYCVEHNYYGIENLSLIPGSVGAAPMQNIGAYGVELKDVLLYVEAFHLSGGYWQKFENDDCHFGYRDSIFKNKYRNQFFIARIVIRLSKVPKFNVSYGSIASVIESNKTDKLSVKTVSDAVISIRRKKLPDPVVLGNAGSFFKNPVLDKDKFDSIKELHPDIPFYSLREKIKIPAAWLIEKCGLKGFRKGKVGCYPNQPLVIVNYGGATGTEVYDFSEMIIERVFSDFSIRLDREVNII